MQHCSLGQGTVSPWFHGALFHAVPECCKCLRQCRINGTTRVGTLGNCPTLWGTVPWELSLVPKSKVASSGLTFTCNKSKELLCLTQISTKILVRSLSIYNQNRIYDTSSLVKQEKVFPIYSASSPLARNLL